jgi:hypothetical protein
MGYKRKLTEARKRRKSWKKRVKDANFSQANRQCLKKVSYASEKIVIQKINDIAEEGRRHLRCYQCPFCELWHISSKARDGQEFIS